MLAAVKTRSSPAENTSAKFREIRADYRALREAVIRKEVQLLTTPGAQR
jgi:hypothetical protein